MKLIFLNRFFYPDHSATSQILSDLAFALVAKGRKVHVITSRLSYDKPQTQLLTQEIVGDVVVHRVWTSRFGRRNLIGRSIDYLSFYFSAAWCLLQLAHRGDVVVIKTDPPLLSVMINPIAWLKGARQINWLQDLFPEVAMALGIGDKGMAKLVALLLKTMRNATLRAADANVVLGDLMAGRLQQVGVDETRIRVIANWANGESIYPIAPENNYLRRQWGLNKKFIIGYSGNFGRVHEFDTLLEAMRILAKQEVAHDITFLFIGDGAQREKLQIVIKERGGNAQFQPYQPREKLAESLSVANVHIISLLPIMEGLIVPSKFYGIAAAGRATAFIGDPDGEIPRLLHQYECGFAVAPGESMQLARHLLELAAEPNRCNEMGMRARMLFEREFDQKTAINKWEVLLSELK